MLWQQFGTNSIAKKSCLFGLDGLIIKCKIIFQQKIYLKINIEGSRVLKLFQTMLKVTPAVAEHEIRTMRL